MRLDDGTLIEANRQYRVAGWATVGAQSPGPDVSQVTADYLRSLDTVRINKLNTPQLMGVAGNPGIAS